VIDQGLWFERLFPSGLPITLMPAIVERLRGTVIRIRAFIDETSPTVLTSRMGSKWSIQEHIGHLLDLEPLWAGRLTDLLHQAPTLSAADLTNRATHEAGHNETSIATLIQKLDDSRNDLVGRLEGLTEKQAEFASLHPRLKTRMRAPDLAYFVAEHDDHHLATMRRLRRELQRD
jgi:uncharacterized damage-inducible protein DinB